MQFDQLDEGEVIWEPYDPATLAVRFPGGISALCTRDQGYWYTKAFLVFDVIVEEMAQQRVMRQFGRRQLSNPPLRQPRLPQDIHRFVNFLHLFTHVG